jgi:hypothetical protein
MDAKNLRHIAAAHETAIAQLDLAAVAVQATGLGSVSPSLQKDLHDLIDLQDRMSRRLKALTSVVAQVA